MAKTLTSAEVQHEIREIEASAAETIYSARKKLGLTQVEVSSQLGISQALLSKIENGILAPGLGAWFRFCEMTGTNPDLSIKTRRSKSR